MALSGTEGLALVNIEPCFKAWGPHTPGRADSKIWLAIYPAATIGFVRKSGAYFSSADLDGLSNHYFIQ